MKYLRQFNNSAAYNAAKEGSDFFRPCVSLIKDTMGVSYDPYIPPRPLKFKSNGNNTVSLNNFNNAPDIKYSLDRGYSWIQWDYSAISLNDGDEICFKGNNPNGFSSTDSSGWNAIYSNFVFSGNGTIEASGNIMSLIDDGACETLVIPSNYCFYKMFYECTSLITAPELPATTLKKNCYQNMFYGCTSLTIAPAILPAIKLI